MLNIVSKIEDTALGLYAQALVAKEALLARGSKIDISSNRGVEGPVWNVLTLMVVGAIAIALLFAIAPAVMARARTASARLNQDPGWNP